MKYALLFIIFIVAIIFFRYLKSLQDKYQEKQNPDKQSSKPANHETALEKQAREVKEREQARIEALKSNQLNLSYGRILLRPFEKLDEKPLSVILSNKKVSEPVGLPVISRVSQVKPLLEKFSDDVGVYAIVILSSERLIGLAEIKEAENNDNSANILIVIGRQFWRHGFGTEAARALIQKAKEEGYSTVTANINKDNGQAIAFAKSLGFTDESNGLYELKIASDK